MASLPSSRRLLTGLGVALFAVLTVGGPVRAASGPPQPDDKPERVTFGIGPGGQAYIDQRSSLSYAAPPGGQLLDRVAVFNQSNQALDLLVYPSDATNSGAGGLAVLPRSERNLDLGAWVTLGPDARSGRVVASGRSLVRVSVPAQSRTKGIGKVVVPMRVIVPSDAAPGDHQAGIVVALLSKGQNPQSQNIELEQRVALRVYVRVYGAVRAGLAVRVLHEEYVGGSGLGVHGTLRVTYRVTNTGNVRLGASTALVSKGPLGIGRRTRTGPKVAELVPGGSAVLTADVADVWPTVLGWTRVVAVAVAPPNGPSPRVLAASDSARFWAITWQEVVAVLLLAGWVAYLRWRRGRQVPPWHADGGSAGRRLPANISHAPALVLALVPVLAMGVALAHAERARADELGRVEVSPTAGTDETLMNGAIGSARCPAGTNNSFFSVDGPGLPPHTAFIGVGTSTGSGYQSFDGASIANIRTANSTGFQRSGSYTIRFSCEQDGRITDSYTRVLDYVAGGRGSFRLRGYPTTMPSYHPLPTPGPERADPKAVPTVQQTSSSGVPSATAGPAQRTPATSPPAPSAARAAADDLAADEGVVAPWLVLAASFVAFVVVFLGWRRRARRPPSSGQASDRVRSP